MLVRFNNRGKGGGSGPTEYLLGGQDHTGTTRALAPVVLRGNVELTKTLIDSLAFAKKYTSGTLCFAEADIPQEQKEQIMDSFQECLFPGLDSSNYDILWVEHLDKGRLELNFVIPCVELQTGKRLQPYFHQADLKRVNAWQGLVNIEGEFSDPHDPALARASTFARDLPKTLSAAVNTITASLVELGVENRLEVIEELQNFGFTISRDTKTSISVTTPNSKKPIRLKGAIYARDFSGNETGRRASEESARQFRESTPERAAKFKEEYQIGSRIRRADLQSRFSKTPEAEAVDFDTGFDSWCSELRQYDAELSSVPKPEKREPVGSTKPVADPNEQNRKRRNLLQSESLPEHGDDSQDKREGLRLDSKLIDHSVLQRFLQSLRQLTASTIQKAKEIKNHAITIKNQLRASARFSRSKNHPERHEPRGRIREDRSQTNYSRLGHFDRSGAVPSNRKTHRDATPIQHTADRDNDVSLEP